MELLIGWAVCAIAAGIIGGAKGRNGFLWFLYGCVLGIFAVIHAAFVKRKTDDPTQGVPVPVPDLAPTAERVECRHCLELVKVGAVVCPHCRRDKPHVDVAKTPPEAPAAAPVEVEAEEVGVDVVIKLSLMAIIVLAIVFVAVVYSPGRP